MIEESNKELAESTRRYVIQFLTNFDHWVLVKEGPHEAFNEFLCNYGYQYSDFIMEQIIPTGIFNDIEIKILTEIEDLMAKLLLEHKDVDSWDSLSKKDYLQFKSLIYDYLTLVYDLKHL